MLRLTHLHHSLHLQTDTDTQEDKTQDNGHDRHPPAEAVARHSTENQGSLREGDWQLERVARPGTQGGLVHRSYASLCGLSGACTYNLCPVRLLR